MLQQTQVQTVIPYYQRFVAAYPDVRTLARADLQEVLKSWEKMGYYARARNLHSAARRLTDESGGAGIPRDYVALRELPGVGDYIAAAVMSIAFGEPRAVVDGNVKRVLARLFEMDSPVNASSSQRLFREHADRLLDHKHPGDYNQALMELGAIVCRPAQPLCDACPVSPFCGAFASGRQHEFPVRAPRKRVPKYHIAVGVIRKDDRILITRRQDDGLLGGLWEFPGGKVRRGERPEDACAREIKEEVNLTVDVTDYLTHVDHAYSHFKIGVLPRRQPQVHSADQGRLTAQLTLKFFYLRVSRVEIQQVVDFPSCLSKPGRAQGEGCTRQ
jgi:A/G-specific adenine glycosylase